VSGARQALRWFLRAGVLGLVAWALGFAWFAADALRPTDDRTLPHADGIVVLTGGQGRIEEAVHLLAAGYADRMLITGVGPHATKSALEAHAAPYLSGDDLRDRMTLGRRAISTVGNAVETREWVQMHGLKSLIVVTAGYHMRRALFEISRTVPDTRLIPCSVRPPALQAPFRRSTLRLLMTEYDKWIGAHLGLQRHHNLLDAT